jgi:hypothetical protein
MSIQTKLISARKISEMLRWDIVRIVFMKMSNDCIEGDNLKKTELLMEYLRTESPDPEQAIKKIRSLYTKSAYRQKAG